MSGMDTHRTTHLARLAELRAEAERLTTAADTARSCGQYGYAALLSEGADNAWGSYSELKAGTQ